MLGNPLEIQESQYSSGGKTRLGRITKAGDAYLRTMLILGARAVLAAAKNKGSLEFQVGKLGPLTQQT